MAHHVLEMPITEEQVRNLKIGDTVTLEQTLFGPREQKCLLARGIDTRHRSNPSLLTIVQQNIHAC